MVATPIPELAHAVTPLVVLGGGVSYGEIGELIRDINAERERFRVVAVLDDNPELQGHRYGDARVEGGLARARDYGEAQFVFGIGSFRSRLLRYELLQRLGLPDERFATLIHPRAKVYSDARLGPGVIVHANSVVSTGAVLDAFVIVTYNDMIGPGAHLGRCALIGAGALVLSNAQIEPCAFVGAGSCIGEGVRIGAGAMVGMGSTVTRDVGRGECVVGTPARILHTVAVPDEITPNS